MSTGQPAAAQPAPATATPATPGAPARSAARSLPFGWKLPWVALIATVAGLLAGSAAHLAGSPEASEMAWRATGTVGGAYCLRDTVEALRHRRIGVNAIALLAIGGAMAVDEFFASGVIAMMMATGRTLESWATGRARRDQRALLERAPRTAQRYRGDALETVEIAGVRPGDRLLVTPGQLVPVDGTLTGGPAMLDEAPLTGEPLTVQSRPGDPVRSGLINAGGPFDLTASSSGAESTYEGIVRLMSQAQSSRASFVRRAERYATWFLPISLAAAGVAWAAAGPERAVAVLVVATPGPLILAAPMALVAGLSAAARRGVVVKGGAVLERLARCTTVLLDKTGTVTSGRPSLTGVTSAGDLPADEVLALAASLDQVSQHVLATAVVSAAVRRGRELTLPVDVSEVPGQGIRGTVAGRCVAVGNESWCGADRVDALGSVPDWVKVARRRARLDGALTAFVAVDEVPAGVLVLDEAVRPDASGTIRALRAGGIDRVVMMTGDRADVADMIGVVIGVDGVLAERTPDEKLAAVRLERGRAPIVMVGDGINDAPALAVADVGVAMGARGSASSPSADAVLTVDRIDRLGEVARVARRTRRIAAQSVVAGMGMSLAAMVVAGLGWLPPVWGALAQEAIDVAMITNALRALRRPSVATRLPAGDTALAQRLRGEHETIRVALDQARAAADALGVAPPDAALAAARRAHALLIEVIEPHGATEHGAAEQDELYPACAEISHQVRRLGGLLDDIGAGPPDQVDVADLRGLLHGLHVIVRLHTAQEDESHPSLAEEPV